MTLRLRCPQGVRGLSAIVLLAICANCAGSKDSGSQDRGSQAVVRQRPSESFLVFDPAADLAAAVIEVPEPEASASSALTRATELQATFDHLLTEHASLTIAATRAAIDAGPHFEAFVGALAANRVRQMRATGHFFGPAVVRPFGELWGFHDQLQVDYAMARAANDETRTQTALAGLRDFRADFAAFVNAITDEKASIVRFGQALDTHVAQITAATDAYIRTDYQLAVERQIAVRASSYNLAKVFVSAIFFQRPEAFPDSVDTEAATETVRRAAQADSDEVQLLIDAGWANHFHPDIEHLLEAAAERARRPGSTLPRVDDLLTPGFWARGFDELGTKELLAFGTALSENQYLVASEMAHKALAIRADLDAP